MASMVALGLALSSEEHGPAELVDLAVAAEGAGFHFVSISDHYHPWLGDQGHSPFVWTVVGAIAARTTRLGVGTGVTCPTVRIHPAVIAQAAATTSLLLPDRFVFGVGSGEALNEHIFGDRWPPADVRLEMLEEAVEVIRKLWTGESVTHYGDHYTVEDARLFDPPEWDIPIVVSAFGPAAAKVAARCGDGLWMSTPNADVVKEFFDNGGAGPVFGQISCCYDRDADAAAKTAHHYWRTAGVPGQLSQDLPTVAHFETASSTVKIEDMPGLMPCGPDLDPIVEKAREAIEAGVDHLYFHQIGPRQDEFVRVWETELRDRVIAAAA
jgi:coenzyme F420-dependent glucose-6-phosphate dehydrogenase